MILLGNVSASRIMNNRNMNTVAALAVNPAIEPTKTVAKLVITSILTSSVKPDVSI